MPFHVFSRNTDAMGKHEVMALLAKDPRLRPEAVLLHEQGDRPLEVEPIQDLPFVSNKGCV